MLLNDLCFLVNRERLDPVSGLLSKFFHEMTDISNLTTIIGLK
jgi:hypothetical protein